MTITAATAAAQAAVTIPTIRGWCRTNAVSAVKRAGRWAIDPASLASRIAIGAMRAARRPRKAPAPAALHQQPGQAEYRRRRGAWTVYVTGTVLDSLKADAAAGGPLTVTVTKRDGTTKTQPVTGRAWTDLVSRNREACRYHLEIPLDEPRRPTTTTPGPGTCAECDRYARHLEDAADSSGIVLPVCGRCARLPEYLRSYG